MFEQNVDGRFRTACALNALKHIPEERRLRTFVAFHNINPPHRQYALYGLVLAFADVVENATKWMVLRRKRHVNDSALDAALEHVAFDYH